MPQQENIDYKALYLKGKKALEDLGEKLQKSEEHQKKLEQKLESALHQISLLQRMVFGSKSEKFGREVLDGQMSLFGDREAIIDPDSPDSYRDRDNTPGSDNEEKKPETPKRKSKSDEKTRLAIPEHLIKETIHIHPDDLPEGSKEIGTEISYRLEGTPSTLYGVMIIRHKYLLPTPVGEDGLGSKIIVPELPKNIIKNCMAGATLLALLLIEKYVDHLPIYRQMKRFLRNGIKLKHNTLIDWINRTCTLLWPLYEALVDEVLASDYKQMDETILKVMDPDKKGKTHKGYLWGVNAPVEKLVIFQYDKSRSKEVPNQMMAGHQGILQTDGYPGYNDFIGKPGVIHACCMVHCRRYFTDALAQDPLRAKYALEVFQKLYAIEAEHKNSTPQERQKARMEKARPIWDAFGEWLDQEVHYLTPDTPIYEAFAYTLNRFERLAYYMEDGKMEIDNNSIERAIRPIALGRKNFLFAGSHDAAARIAVAYSLMGTCKMQDVNPFVWLSDVLGRIDNQAPDKMHELLPHHWAKANPDKITKPVDAIIRVPVKSKSKTQSA